MALGNGLPDISSTFVAVSTDAFGLSIGELLGAGVFVTTIIVAGISLSSTTQLDKGPFLRDTFFYLFAICLILGIVADNSVNNITYWKTFISNYQMEKKK